MLERAQQEDIAKAKREGRYKGRAPTGRPRIRRRAFRPSGSIGPALSGAGCAGCRC